MALVLNLGARWLALKCLSQITPFLCSHVPKRSKAARPVCWRTCRFPALTSFSSPPHSLAPATPGSVLFLRHMRVSSPQVFVLPVPSPLPRLLFPHVLQVFAQTFPFQSVLNMSLKIATFPRPHTLHSHPDLLFIFVFFNHPSPSSI